MTIQWIEAVDWFEGEPQWGDQGPAGLAGVGLGAPPGCPSGTTVTSEYGTCRSQTQQAAQGFCSAAAAQIAAGEGTWAQLGYSSQGDCNEKKWNEFYFGSNCVTLCGPEITPPCTSPQIVSSVQEDLGRPVTGVWTADDQAALNALGTTFEAYAPDCTGPAPVPVGPSPGPGPAPKPTPKPTAKKGAGLGVVLLAAAAAVAIAMAQS